MTHRHSIVTVGHACWDRIQFIPAIPKQNHKVIASATQQTAGGSAARTALALADHADVRMISILGYSTLPETVCLTQMLQKHHVDVSLCQFDSDEGSLSSIWVTPDGARTIASSHTPDHAISFGHDISAEGALFDNNKPLLNSSVRQRLKENCIKLLDVDSVATSLVQLFGYNQVWFSSETFGQWGMSLSNMSALLKCVVGVTDGANPVLWHDGRNRHTVSPPSVCVRNSVGAGDLWRSSLMLNLLGGADLYSAVVSACENTAQQLSVDPTAS